MDTSIIAVFLNTNSQPEQLAYKILGLIVAISFLVLSLYGRTVSSALTRLARTIAPR